MQLNRYNNTMASLIERNYDKLLQLIVIGDVRVGKTAICRQFVWEESPTDDLNATIGLDLNLKLVRARGMRVKLQIWDMAGQERFDNLTTRYYDRAHGVVIVYDVTRENTFRNVYNWLQLARVRCKENVPIILVGNKTDLSGKRRVMASSGRKLAETERLNFLETSAITKESIQNLFLTMTHSILEKVSVPFPKLEKYEQKEHDSYSIDTNIIC